MQSYRVIQSFHGIFMSAALVLVSTGCAVEEPQEEVQDSAQGEPDRAAAVRDTQDDGTGKVILNPAEEEQQMALCSINDCGGGGGGDDWPYYTLYWRAHLLSLKCSDATDVDGKDEVWLESEVTGDNQSDRIWGVNDMRPGDTVSFDPMGSYPPPLQFQTYAVGATGKLVALWDASTSWFDLEEQIGVAYIPGQRGTYTKVIQSADARYELTFSVEPTGCAPLSLPCPTNL